MRGDKGYDYQRATFEGYVNGMFSSLIMMKRQPKREVLIDDEAVLTSMVDEAADVDSFIENCGMRVDDILWNVMNACQSVGAFEILLNVLRKCDTFTENTAFLSAALAGVTDVAKREKSLRNAAVKAVDALYERHLSRNTAPVKEVKAVEYTECMQKLLTAFVHIYRRNPDLIEARIQKLMSEEVAANGLVYC
jgi:hypothetical protein